MNKKWTLALSGALAVALLSGCGAKADNAASGQAAQQGQGNNAAGQAGQWQGRGGMGMVDENGNPASLIGKVKSVSGQTITVYKSTFDPSRMAQGGGQRPSGNGQNGGSPAPGAGNGQAPSGSAQNGSGQNGSGNRGQGRGMANMFSDETEDITITDATKIESVSFENGQATTKELAVTDLKADDVLTIWLKDGTQEAATIRVGGFGGGNRGQRPGGGQGQQGQSSQAPNASPSAAANG